jgi:hypothetical protein
MPRDLGEPKKKAYWLKKKKKPTGISGGLLQWQGCYEKKSFQNKKNKGDFVILC